ncbi:MAG TPA: phage regulatory CII family protein [Sphingomonas sp.]|jgi:hypothetical protein
MTKLRVPHSWADATTRIAGLLGYEAAGHVVGRSDRTIYEWANPESATRPTLEQMLALDAAYIAAGGQGAPFLDAHAHQLDLVVVAAKADCRELVEEVGEAAIECGEAMAAALTVSVGNAPPIEVHRALAHASEAGAAIAAVERRLSSFLPTGTGPTAGNTGGTHV